MTEVEVKLECRYCGWMDTEDMAGENDWKIPVCPECGSELYEVEGEDDELPY